MDASAASMVAVEETSTPKRLTATQVSVSTSIVVNLMDEALNNSEVQSMTSVNNSFETLLKTCFKG